MPAWGQSGEELQLSDLEVTKTMWWASVGMAGLVLNSCFSLLPYTAHKHTHTYLVMQHSKIIKKTQQTANDVGGFPAG